MNTGCCMSDEKKPQTMCGYPIVCASCNEPWYVGEKHQCQKPAQNDPQIGSFYICEKCEHIFNWNLTRNLCNGVAEDGTRICPRCGTEFVRKFRESDNQKSLEPLQEADTPTIVE